MPRGRARAFGIDDSGLAAIEFAFVLPLMLAIYLGIVELSNGLSASRKVDLVAHAMSDLTGQITGGGAGSGQAAITDAEMQQIFLAGAALIAPLSATPLTITISEVNIQLVSGAYKATVNWSVSYNGGTLRNGQGCALNTYLNAADVPPVSAISMPTSFTNATLSPTLGPVIVADVTYNYNLGLGNLVEQWLPTGSILMKRTSYSPVRNQYVNPNPGPPTLLNHIQSPTTATSWTTAISGSTNVNCLGYLTPAQH
jgi:Flp pilus assembly protein TadG